MINDVNEFLQFTMGKICLIFRYDFFLVSQHVRQGTVSPTHYIVVHDDSGMKADHMQRLAYKMTHMYYNWPGTVRVPAPCQVNGVLVILPGLWKYLYNYLLEDLLYCCYIESRETSVLVFISVSWDSGVKSVLSTQ